MQVLLINQFFWPDTAATGQLLTDITREIDPKVHAVDRVVRGVAVWCRRQGLPASSEDCAVWRRGLFKRQDRRVVSYASFFASAAIRGVRGPKPALVVTLTTPPLISLLGTLLKSLRGSRHFIWEMDVYPDILVSLNVLKPRSVVTRLIAQWRTSREKEPTESSHWATR